MKVIEAWTEQGNYLVCDGRCYEPREDKPVICRCLCQGFNHAAGWRNAVWRTRANVAKWINEHDTKQPEGDKIVRWTVAFAVSGRLKREYMWKDERFEPHLKPKNKVYGKHAKQ